MGRWQTAVDKTGGGIFMDLQNGTNRIRVLSDPVVENKTFDDGPSTIFSWKVWDYATSTVRVLSKGPSFLRKFDFFTESWGDDIPMKCDIVVDKTGSGMGTRYEFASVPVKEQMNPDWEIQLNRIDWYKIKPNAIPIADFSTKDQAEAKADSMRAGINRSMDNIAAQSSDDTPPENPDEVVEDLGDEPINLNEIFPEQVL